MKDIINYFCNNLDTNRAKNIVEMENSFQTARLRLSRTSRREMAAMDPIWFVITKFEDKVEKEKSRGGGNMNF